MPSFLFWNVMKRDLRDVVVRAVVEHAVDILILAESGTDDQDLVALLNAANRASFESLSDPEDKVRLFSSIPATHWQKRQSDPIARMAIWSIEVGPPPGILLAAAHFQSKNNLSAGGQGLLTAELAKEICVAEENVGHNRTVLVGDLNMNPFELGVTGMNALHAVMTKKIAGKLERTVSGKKYRFFYNPMWGHFGDCSSGPPGTYYRHGASPDEIFWHILDQVLIRPELMKGLRDLAILELIDGQSLLSSRGGLPLVSKFSDHLPLTFRLDL